MGKSLSIYFKLVDYAKNLLFNATTDEQEQRARRLLDYHNKQADYLYVKKEALVNDYQSNN